MRPVPFSINAPANELLHRRADIADAMSAHLLAVEWAPAIGFGRYIVSATTLFDPHHLVSVARDVAGVVREPSLARGPHSTLLMC